MGYTALFSNRIGAGSLANFQFPLWDTAFGGVAPPIKNIKTFNSLYGIQKPKPIEKKEIVNFQFPLWDTFFSHIYSQFFYPFFQFPLWDTNWFCCFFTFRHGTFNSLYGILFLNGKN